MATKHFEDVIAWQQARTLTGEILSVTGSLDSFRKEIELCRRLQNIALDIQSEIARSFASNDSTRFLEGLKTALELTEVLRSLLFSAADRECINLRTFERLTRSIQSCSAKIQELMGFVKQQLRARKNASVQQTQKQPSVPREGITIRDSNHSSRTAGGNSQIVQDPAIRTSRQPISVSSQNTDQFPDEFDFFTGSGHADFDPGQQDPLE